MSLPPMQAEDGGGVRVEAVAAGGEEGDIPLPLDVIAAYCHRTPVVTREESTVNMSAEATGWLALSHQKEQYNLVLNNIRKQMKKLEALAIPFVGSLKSNEVALTTFTTEEEKVLGPPGKLRLVSKKRPTPALTKDHMQQAMHHFLVSNMKQVPLLDEQKNPQIDEKGNVIMGEPELTLKLGASTEFVQSVVSYTFSTVPVKAPILTLVRSIKSVGGGADSKKRNSSAMDISGGGGGGGGMLLPPPPSSGLQQQQQQQQEGGENVAMS